MLTEMFSDAGPETVEAAAEHIARVGLAHAPTAADVDEFVRSHALLLNASNTPQHQTSSNTSERRRTDGPTSSQQKSSVGILDRGRKFLTARLRRAAHRSLPQARKQADQRRTALEASHRLHFELLMKALDDPTLSEVLDIYDTQVSEDRRRQFLFSNALHANFIFSYRAGLLNWEELHGYARTLLRNSIFRKYWEATRHYRASLPAESEEARINQMIDQLAQDLDESDAEEWWIVGSPFRDEG